MMGWSKISSHVRCETTMRVPRKGHHLSQAVHQTTVRVSKRGMMQPKCRQGCSFIISLHLLPVLCLHRSYLPFPLILLLPQPLRLLRQEIKLGCLDFIACSLNCQVDLSLSQLVLQTRHFQDDLRWYCCHRRCHRPSFPWHNRRLSLQVSGPRSLKLRRSPHLHRTL